MDIEDDYLESCFACASPRDKFDKKTGWLDQCMLGAISQRLDVKSMELRNAEKEAQERGTKRKAAAPPPAAAPALAPARGRGGGPRKVAPAAGGRGAGGGAVAAKRAR